MNISFVSRKSNYLSWSEHTSRKSSIATGRSPNVYNLQPTASKMWNVLRFLWIYTSLGKEKRASRTKKISKRLVFSQLSWHVFICLFVCLFIHLLQSFLTCYSRCRHPYEAWIRAYKEAFGKWSQICWHFEGLPPKTSFIPRINEFMSWNTYFRSTSVREYGPKDASFHSPSKNLRRIRSM